MSQLQGKLLFPFIAPPNGGKGTQTRILSERYNLPVFDMGATFRHITKNEPESDLAKEIRKFMDAGKLVPIETVMKVFVKGFEALVASNPTSKGFILDGFPRSLEQSNALLDLCNQWKAKIGKAIFLNVPSEVVTKRATGRRFCPVDEQIYNIFSDQQKPQRQKTDQNGLPAKDDAGLDIWLCDRHDAELELRSDDRPEKVKERLDSFEKETQPVLEQFKARGELAEVNGNQPVDKVTQDITQHVQPVLELTPAS